MPPRSFPNRRKRTNSGKALQARWKIDAEHCLYHVDGRWYMPPKYFPAALCDPHGFVRFETREDYQQCRYLRIADRVDVVGGHISLIPGYRRMI